MKSMMKFTVRKDALLAGLASVPNVVSSQTTLSILSNVLIEADASDGVLRLSTTDLDLRVCRSVQAPVEQGGQITLPARHLLSIVRALPEGDISFEATGRM
jgi:DNA polymerase III subunit beta